MANWRADLDALVEETMAFSRSIKTQTPLPRPVLEPNRLPAMNWMMPEREEIQQRVAAFKALQRRFIKEREDYAAAEWNRVLALRGTAIFYPEVPPPHPRNADSSI